MAGRLTTLRTILTPRQVNLLLEVLVGLALVTGLVSWLVPLSSARLPVAVHAIAGVLVLLAAPLKLRGSVRTGFRRGRSSRWLSAAFGVLVLATIGLGVAHTTGLWFGVGYWTPLWTHQLFGVAVLPLLVWHVTSRPVRPRATDVNRRGFLVTSGAVVVGATALAGQELVLDWTGATGGDRAGTGSLEIASFRPGGMPRVQWLNDRAPADTDPVRWSLTVGGRMVAIEELWDRAETVTARLDCTGGWFSIQEWDAVPVSALLDAAVEPGGPTDLAEARSIRVTSATGYGRLYPLDAADSLHLAVGYGGEALRRGHGAPVRLVAPDRRGPQWVKWVVEVAPDRRPAWLQLPLPPT